MLAIIAQVILLLGKQCTSQNTLDAQYKYGISNILKIHERLQTIQLKKKELYNQFKNIRLLQVDLLDSEHKIIYNQYIQYCDEALTMLTQFSFLTRTNAPKLIRRIEAARIYIGKASSESINELASSYKKMHETFEQLRIELDYIFRLFVINIGDVVILEQFN